jgi:hypothetical protein
MNRAKNAVAACVAAWGLVGCVVDDGGSPTDADATSTVERTVVRLSPDGNHQVTTSRITSAQQREELNARAQLFSGAAARPWPVPLAARDPGCAYSSMWIFDNDSNITGAHHRSITRSASTPAPPCRRARTSASTPANACSARAGPPASPGPTPAATGSAASGQGRTLGRSAITAMGCNSTSRHTRRRPAPRRRCRTPRWCASTDPPDQLFPLVPSVTGASGSRIKFLRDALI